MTGLVAVLIGACTEPSNRTGGTEPEKRPTLRFEEVTEAAGLGKIRHLRGTTGQELFPKMMGAGVAFIDADSDGNQDLLVVGGGHIPEYEPSSGHPSLYLYRNEGDGAFEPYTGAAGLDSVDAYGYGLAVADHDNDGDQDFVLTTLHGLRLFENRDGAFREVTEESGLDGYDAFWTAAVFFDADRDGRLDLYVGGYVRWPGDEDVNCTVGGRSTAYCTPQHYEGISGRFFRNLGDGRFTDRTEEVGMQGVPGKTLGAVTLDPNRDGWPDLFVANDTNRDLLFVNQGDGTFDERARMSGVAFSLDGRPRGGMGVDAGVLDSTGQPSIVVGNFSSEMTGVYRHAGNLLFDKRTTVSQVGRPSLPISTFGLVLFDADLDQDLDLFAANGHLQPFVDEVDNAITYRQRPHLFLNDGTGHFQLVDSTVGTPLTRPLLARGAATADYDQDGDLDLVVTENHGPLHLWENRQDGGHSVRIELTGTRSNRDGVGSRIQAWVGSTSMSRRVHTGGSYLSQSELTVTFGLGSANMLDSLRVRWPSGHVDRWGSVSADQTIRVRETRSRAVRQPESE